MEVSLRMGWRLRRWPTGLIGMIGLLLLVEGLLTVRFEGLARRLTLSARFAAEESARGATACQVLGLGDSAMKFGFDPTAVERVTGLRGYNLAVPGTPPPIAEAILRRALGAGARPSVVVIGFVSFSGNPWRLVPEFAEVLDTAETIELACDFGDPGLFAAVTLARVMPSIRLRQPLRALVIAKILGGGQLDTGAGQGAARASLRHWAENLGRERPRTIRPADERTDPFMTSGVFDHPWPVVPAFERSFRRIVAQAEAHGARVIWLIPPVAPYAQASRDALGFEAEHTQNLHAIQEQVPRVVVLDARRAEIPASEFLDACHLNPDGASRFSADVAATIRRSELPRVVGDAPPVWLALSRAGRETPRTASKSAADPSQTVYRWKPRQGGSRFQATANRLPGSLFRGPPRRRVVPHSGLGLAPKFSNRPYACPQQPTTGLRSRGVGSPAVRPGGAPATRVREPHRRSRAFPTTGSRRRSLN